MTGKEDYDGKGGLWRESQIMARKKDYGKIMAGKKDMAGKYEGRKY